MSKHNGLFYCHYSVSYIYSQHSEIGVATSSSLEPGSWNDHGAIGLPQSPSYNLIDPFLFADDGGEADAEDGNGENDAPLYFTFGSHWTGIQQLEVSSPEKVIAWDGDVNGINNIVRNASTTAPAVVEGASMHKHEGWYYIFFSVGQCCRHAWELVPAGDEYRIVVCRSETPTGPFVDREGRTCVEGGGGTTLLASHGDVYAPGGQGVLKHPETWRAILYYHYGMFARGVLGEK